MELRNSPTRSGRPAAITTQHPVRQHAPGSRKQKWFVSLAVVAVVIIGLIVWHLLHAPTAPRSDRYQAVYVQTGQVYFGKLKNTDGRYLQLDDVYIAKAQDVPADATDEQKAAVSSNVSLTKVSDQVYGPEDTMMIRADQVVFWQDLTEDSKVARAIEQQP